MKNHLMIFARAVPAEYARTLGNGDILRLTPCHVLKFLRGRTLWLIG